MSDADHECVFVEEQVPGGRLILPPCIVCGLTGMDALEQLRNERADAWDEGWQERDNDCSEPYSPPRVNPYRDDQESAS